MGATIRFCFDESSDELDNVKVKSFFDLGANDINGNYIDFYTFRGKKAFLIVNVASKCTLTNKNYKALTKMYN